MSEKTPTEFAPEAPAPKWTPAASPETLASWKAAYEAQELKHESQRAAIREAQGNWPKLAELLRSDSHHDGFIDTPGLEFIYLVEERHPEEGDVVAYAARTLEGALEWAASHTSAIDLIPGGVWAVIAQVIEAAADELPSTLLAYCSPPGQITLEYPDALADSDL